MKNNNKTMTEIKEIEKVSSYYKLMESKIDSILDKNKKEWVVNVRKNGCSNETVVEFNTGSPAGEDFYATLVIDGTPTIIEIAENLREYWDNFNPVAEALIWVDSEGHGKNGAPDLEELIADKKQMKEELHELYLVINEACNADV